MSHAEGRIQNPPGNLAMHELRLHLCRAEAAPLSWEEMSSEYPSAKHLFPELKKESTD